MKPKTKTYKLMKAWGQEGGSYPDYISRQIDRAKEIDAPELTLYLEDEFEERGPTIPHTLDNSPKLPVFNYIGLEKRLASIENRDVKPLDEVVEYLAKHGNFEAIKKLNR